jgi:hypothetical protein
MKWDYIKQTCNLSMPGYIQAAVHKFQHPHPKREQHVPHQWIAPTYGAKQQLTQPIDDSKPLPPPELIKRVQQITGTLLYYARVVDATLLVALVTIAEQQAKET